MLELDIIKKLEFQGVELVIHLQFVICVGSGKDDAPTPVHGKMDDLIQGNGGAAAGQRF